MAFILDVLRDAWSALIAFGPELRGILVLTLVVSGVATVIGVVLGVPLGVALGLGRFRGRVVLLALVNTGMGMPPVLAGLVVLLVLWNDGPLGSLGLLFTPAAMIVAQVLLAVPIAAGVAAGAVGGLSGDVREQLAALRVGPLRRGWIAGIEVWPGIAVAVAAAFGRVVSEVGAVLIVGGNIAGETRVLTTAIVEEARQARFGVALALGGLLLAIALATNLVLTWLQLHDRRAH